MPAFAQYWTIPLFFSMMIEKEGIMSDIKIDIPKWFWIVSGVALVWNLIGVMAYIGAVTLTPDQLAEYPEAEQALYTNIPVWATSMFAVGVFGGAIGSVFLLLRRGLAFPVFIASLIGVVVYNFYFIGMKNSLAVTGVGNLVMQGVVAGIGIFLIWFARSSVAKGWLR